MQVVSITQADLDYREVFTKGLLKEDLYGIKNQVLIQLYYFFKRHDQNCIYRINIDENTADSVFRAQEFTTYNSYGIYAMYANYDLDEFDRNFLIVIPEEVLSDELTLRTFIENKKNSTNIKRFTCIIEKDYSGIEKPEFKQHYKLFKSVCPEITVLNPGFESIGTVKYYSVREQLMNYIENTNNNNFILFDAGNLLNNVEFYISTATNMQSAFSLAKAIEQAVYEQAKLHNVQNSNVIVYCDSFNSEQCHEIYLGIIAYLTMARGIHCYVSRDDRTVFLEYVRRITSQRYNYLSDYLRIIKNFPNFTISFNGQSASFCIKDLQRIAEDNKKPIENRRYIIRMSAYCVKIDKESCTFLDDVSTKKIILYENLINIIDFRDVFDLSNPDLSICLNQYNELNQIIVTFGKQLRERTTYLNDTSLNCNNMLMFESNNSRYLAYISEIDYKLPFNMKPFASGYSFAHHEFDVSEFRNLYDTNLIFDIDPMINLIINQNPAYGKNRHFNLKGTAVNGSILSGIAAKPEKFRDCKPLTFSDIGIWSVQTSQLRDRSVGGLADIMNINELIRSDYVGFYGGLHPAKSVDMEIRSELWR